jgi:hypothetical protein
LTDYLNNTILLKINHLKNCHFQAILPKYYVKNSKKNPKKSYLVICWPFWVQIYTKTWYSFITTQFWFCLYSLEFGYIWFFGQKSKSKIIQYSNKKTHLLSQSIPPLSLVAPLCSAHLWLRWYWLPLEIDFSIL